MGPVCGRLDQGRIHFQHGHIDLVIFALGESAVIEEAHAKAWARFGQILPEWVAELPDLRQAVDPRVQCGRVGPVARRMWSACRPFARDFIAPVAAVAGSPFNRKITTPEDLAWAEGALAGLPARP